MKADFGEQILKLSRNTKLKSVDLTQIVVIKIIQDRFSVSQHTSGSKILVAEIVTGFGFKLEDKRR